MEKRFIAIDNFSGYIFGDATAETPEEACRKIDTKIGFPRASYEEISGSGISCNQSAYHVYDAGGSDIVIDDGQDQESIDFVTNNLKKVAVIAWKESEQN